MKILYVASKNKVAGVDEYAALRKVYSNTEIIDPSECFFFRYIFNNKFLKLFNNFFSWLNSNEFLSINFS